MPNLPRSLFSRSARNAIQVPTAEDIVGVTKVVQDGDITLDANVTAWEEVPTGYTVANGYVEFFGVVAVEPSINPESVRLVPMETDELPPLFWGDSEGLGWSLGYPCIVHHDHWGQAASGRMSAVFAGNNPSDTIPGLWVWGNVMIPDPDAPEKIHGQGVNLPLPYDTRTAGAGGNKFNVCLNGIRWKIA